MKRFSLLFYKIITFYKLIKIKKIEIKFSNPKRSKILVVDHAREKEVQEVLLNDIEFETLDTRINESIIYKNYSRSPRIFISFKIILLILYFFFIKKTNSLFSSYCYAYIYITKPKILLDLSHYGFLVKGVQYFSDTKFIFILEGLFKKNDYLFPFKENANIFHYYLIDYLKKNNKLKLDNLYLAVQGQKDIDILEDLGLHQSMNNLKFIFAGSYKADFVRKKTNNNYEKKYDIIFISQLSPEYLLDKNKNKNTIDKFVTEETEKILKLLSSYVIKKNVSCLIQLRTSKSRNKIEKEFFKSFFKDYEKLYFKDRNEPFSTSTYYSILESDLTISNHSQLSHEAMILDRKSLTVPLKMYDYYTMYPNKFASYSSLWDWNITIMIMKI